MIRPRAAPAGASVAFVRKAVRFRQREAPPSGPSQLRAVSRLLPEPVSCFQSRRLSQGVEVAGMRVFIALFAVRRASSAEGFPRRSSLACFLP